MSVPISVLSALFSPSEKRGREWLSNDDGLWEGAITASGARVTSVTAMQLSTVWACVRLLTNTIATLPTDIVVSLGSQRFVEFSRPSWLVNPDPANPTMTSTEHFAQVATSLLLDGNFFTYLPGGIFNPSVMIVLDPRRVDVKADGRTPYYEIRDGMGRLVATVDALHMLHGAWIKMPGQLRGLSPIEAARQGIGLGLTAEEFGSRFFGQGTTLSYGVEVPGAMTDIQREELRANLKQRHAGTKNAHSVSVLTAGAKFVPGLGVTNDQAQFLELRKFQVEDIARWFGVPPHMVGSQEPGASSYNSVEQRSLEFREYAVLPLVRRIEDPYQRLVEVPDRLRSANASAALKFNLDGLARADLKTRFESYQAGITAGVIKPDEARAWEDLPPVPGGDVTYMQQQMVPLGTPPASPTPPATPPPPERSDTHVYLHEQRAAPVEVHAHMPASPEVRVEAPVHVHIPEQAPPTVTVEARADAPVVNVAAPSVTVQTPDEMRITKMPSRMTTRRVTKRAPNGGIAETTDVEEDI